MNRSEKFLQKVPVIRRIRIWSDLDHLLDSDPEFSPADPDPAVIVYRFLVVAIKNPLPILVKAVHFKNKMLTFGTSF
jgi:hypothetical protein